MNIKLITMDYWQRWSPRGHILKSLALASKPQVLENCPVLGSRTALFFEQLKFCWKTTETWRKNFEYLLCFRLLEQGVANGGRGGAGAAPQLKFHQ